MQPLSEFIDWYESLKGAKTKTGPARGSLAIALVVLDRLMKDYNLDFDSHLAPGGMQIKGTGGTAAAIILKSFGEERPLLKEGGRTNRGGPAAIKSLLSALAPLNLERLDDKERNAKLRVMQSFLVDRVRDFHSRQKIKITFRVADSTWHIIHNLLLTAATENKAGCVAQHLVGAKLQLRFPEITVSNEPCSAGDLQTQRPGDFLIGQTAFHITIAPMPAVYEKCKDNLAEGYKPFLLVPNDKVVGARQIADQTSSCQITVGSIESFVSQNINELSRFDTTQLKNSFNELIGEYNRRVDEAETDKSLMIELPQTFSKRPK